MISIYIRHKKHTRKLGKTVYKILVWSLLTVSWDIIFKSKLFSCPKTSRKKLGINLRIAPSVEKFPWMFPKVLTSSTNNWLAPLLDKIYTDTVTESCTLNPSQCKCMFSNIHFSLQCLFFWKSCPLHNIFLL